VHAITYDGGDSLVTVTLSQRLAAECARFLQEPPKTAPEKTAANAEDHVFRDSRPETSYQPAHQSKMRKAQPRA
jgi:hypothetical protein